MVFRSERLRVLRTTHGESVTESRPGTPAQRNLPSSLCPCHSLLCSLACYPRGSWMVFIFATRWYAPCAQLCIIFFYFPTPQSLTQYCVQGALKKYFNGEVAKHFGLSHFSTVNKVNFCNMILCFEFSSMWLEPAV